MKGSWRTHYITPRHWKPMFVPSKIISWNLYNYWYDIDALIRPFMTKFATHRDVTSSLMWHHLVLSFQDLQIAPSRISIGQCPISIFTKTGTHVCFQSESYVDTNGRHGFPPCDREISLFIILCLNNYLLLYIIKVIIIIIYQNTTQHTYKIY